jgi:Tfp pilus assembly protein PilW
MQHTLLHAGRALQSGFSLTELMVSSGLSLGVIASALTGYLALSTRAMDTLDASKLDQDIGAVLLLMANELRRAGHAGAATPPAANPFTSTLAVFDSLQANHQQAPTGSGSCVVYGWDADDDGKLAASELAGFRLTADGAVQMRSSGNLLNPNSCSSQDATWIALTDPELVTVSTLHVDFAQSTCVNASEPDGVDNDGNGAIDEANETDCYALPPVSGSGNLSVEQPDITITLSAQLTSEAFVRVTQTQRVRLRNALVRRH